MKKLNLFIILNFLLFFLNTLGFSNSIESIFNSNISKSEINLLKSGKAVFRNTKNKSNICIKNLNQQINELYQQLNDYKPNYLAEIIKIIPINSNKNLIQEINNILVDIPSYKGIPYYSEHNDLWVDLYSQAKIISEEKNINSNHIEAYFFMKPFNEIYSTIKINKTKNSLFYINKNKEPIKYKGITCINTNNMRSFITIFQIDEYWVLYGIGGVNAPKVPFVTKRIELSFINRIKTFCNYVFEKMNFSK